MREVLATTDYYEILGCARGCSQASLKRAYYKRALKLHPDKNPAAGAADAFKGAGSSRHHLLASSLIARQSSFNCHLLKIWQSIQKQLKLRVDTSKCCAVLLTLRRVEIDARLLALVLAILMAFCQCAAVSRAYACLSASGQRAYYDQNGCEEPPAAYPDPAAGDFGSSCADAFRYTA